MVNSDLVNPDLVNADLLVADLLVADLLDFITTSPVECQGPIWGPHGACHCALNRLLEMRMLLSSARFVHPSERRCNVQRIPEKSDEHPAPAP
jgi:hypothetical protein